MAEGDSGALLQAALNALDLASAELISAETRATDTRIWQVRHHGRMLAIRVLREEQSSVVQIERRAMDLARSAGIPAPEVIATVLIDGRYPAMAIEWIEGETVGDVLLSQPVLARRLGVQAGIILARIHSIRNPSLPGSNDWIARGTLHDPQLEAMLIQQSSQTASLLHLDFHPFNLIARGGRVVGVIDWTNTAIGDHRADIARTLSIMQITAPAFISEHGAHRMTMGRFTRALTQEYIRQQGSPGDLAPFLTWSGNWMLADIGPKLDQLPVTRPTRLHRRITQRTAEWRKQALLD